MTEHASLFRSAAVRARRPQDLGEIVLAQSPATWALSLALALSACAVGALACFGRYTAQQTLAGRVVPEQGVVEVRAPQTGTIVERRVGEGELVAIGQPLFVLASERRSAAPEPTDEAVARQLARRRASLVEQIGSVRALEETERAALVQRLAALAREESALREALAAQRTRLEFALASVERYARMRELGYIAEETAAQRQVDVLEQRGRAQALERELASAARLRIELDQRLAAGKLELGAKLAELERAVAATELEIAEHEAARASVVTATQAGRITAVVGAVGEVVERGATLAALVPTSSRLVAELFAPSRAIGFVAVGDEVRLRYAAFPYQKFGHARGVVTAVSATALPPSGGAPPAEPVYRITVALAAQTVEAYGRARPLLPAMAVEADVQLETRRLYEWLFEPLYAFARRID